MNGDKPWYQSVTAWASVVQMMVGVAVALGWLTSDQAAAVTSQAPDLIVGAVTLALGGIGLVGRVRATKTIS